MIDPTQEYPTDRSIPGVHPKLRDLSATAEELLLIGNGPSRLFLNDDERMLADAMNAVNVHTANLAVFLDRSIPTNNRAVQVKFHREALATALYKLGQFEEALKTISTEKGKALSGFAKLRAYILEVQEAATKPDDEFCDCPRPTADLETDNRKQPTVAVELPRRFARERVYSPIHNQVITVWQCHVCGDCNAHDNPPPHQEAARKSRAEIEARQLRGETITVKNAGGLSDAELFKVGA